MKGRRANKIGAFGLALVFAFIGLINYVDAADNNIGYEFKLQHHYKNSYTEIEYRQTKNVNNKWKVNMVYSAEGKGTIATYWLNRPYLFNTTERVSAVHDVKQGSGAHYYKAYKKASQEWVNLGAENNNDTAKSYKVSGYWDEETK